MARSRPRDDDDYEDRPRKRRRRDEDDDRDSGGNKTGLIIAGSVVGGVLLIGGIIAAVVLSSGKKKDTDDPPVAKGENPAPPLPGIGPGIFTPPKSNPPQTPKPDDPPKLGPGVVELPMQNISVTQAVFSQHRTGGYAAIISFDTKGGGGNIIDVVQTATGKAVGRVVIDKPFDDGLAVGPDGKHLAVIDSEPFEGNTVSVFSVTEGKLLKKFRPYPKKQEITAPDLVWVEITANDRLLTVSESGFDIWSLPEFKPVAKADVKLGPGQRLQPNLFTKMPANFSLTQDRETIAIFNGSGFTFHSAVTGASLGKTKAAPLGFTTLITATAFSPDGKQFAMLSQTGGKNTMQLWDVAKGDSISDRPMGTTRSPAGMAFWGPKHLVFHQGGIGTVHIIDLGTLQDVGKVDVTSGKFAPLSPDGNLWAVVGGPRIGNPKDPSYLVKAAVPAEIGTGADWTLSYRGLESKVKTR
jgi:hypothetical protein